MPWPTSRMLRQATHPAAPRGPRHRRKHRAADLTRCTTPLPPNRWQRLEHLLGRLPALRPTRGWAEFCAIPRRGERVRRAIPRLGHLRLQTSMRTCRTAGPTDTLWVSGVCRRVGAASADVLALVALVSRLEPEALPSARPSFTPSRGGSSESNEPSRGSTVCVSGPR
jgi:hypothetical protein